VKEKKRERERISAEEEEEEEVGKLKKWKTKLAVLASVRWLAWQMSRAAAAGRLPLVGRLRTGASRIVVVRSCTDQPE
jgi:hypothetical protein